MPSLIKLDIAFSLVIELKLVVVDTGYFVGLTPIENSQTKIREVLRYIHTRDEAWHMNSKNFAQRRPSSFFMEGRTVSINVYSLIFCCKLSLP